MRLRDAGWRDWHILMAAAMIAVNHRAKLRGLLTPELHREKSKVLAILDEHETETIEAIPLELFNVDNLRFHLQMTMTSTLMGMGLELRDPIPDLVAIEKFIGRRYNYWRLDVPHDELLPT